MDPLRTYDYLTIARQKLFDWIRPLDDEAWRRKFPIGLGTLGTTLTHIMICEWAYMERLRGHTPPPYEAWPIQDEKPPAFEVVEAHWKSQAADTRSTLAAIIDRGEWDKPIEWNSKNREGKEIIISGTPAEVLTQIFSHEVHHRAQAMAMLKQMGVKAEDLDPYYLLLHRREA